MALTLKAELETWAAALKAYDEQDFEKALEMFSAIADSSKILTNMGLIYATIGEHETAVDHFVAATNLDAYLAIAYFQCGVSNFLLERYDLALLNFEDAFLYLRGNEAINYEQIGLKFKLFSAEVTFNKGLAQLNLGYAEEGLSTMQEACKQKVTDEHGVIDEAIRDRGEGYTVFSIPVGVLYRPSEHKLKNSKTKDYLGKAKLVAASDSNDAFTEFTGVKKLQQASGENLDSKSEEGKSSTDSSALSRSATAPAPRTDPIAPRPAAIERARTALPLGAGVRPDPSSRRSQSVSNPLDAPLPPPVPSGLSRSNTARSARTRTNSTGATPPRSRTPTRAIAGVAAGGFKAGAETGTVPARAPTPKSRPNPGRPQGQGAYQAAQQSPHSLQPGQYINAPQGAASLVLPAVPSQAQSGHLTQFYETYMDVYTNDSRLAFPRPPTSQKQPSPPSSRRESPTRIPVHQQTQLQPQEQEQSHPTWMQSDPSPRTPAGPGPSRVPSRATTASSNSNANKGGTSSGGGGSVRRKPVRRPTRKVPTYVDEEGDDGFVTGENEEIDMANIRIKLHYQGDVRGMAIQPTISFNEFVERVTTKFGTSLMGLAMKFTDEEGTMISLRDESDFELAIETARETAKGRSEGKIEVWCTDV